MAHPLHLHQVPRLRMCLGVALHENTARRILHEELSAPIRFRFRNDPPDENRHLLLRLFLGKREHIRRIRQHFRRGYSFSPNETGEAAKNRKKNGQKSS